MAFGNLGTIWAEIGLNTAKLDKGIAAAQIKMKKTDASLTTMGQKLTKNSTKMLLAGGVMVAAVGAVGIASIKMAADYETSMRNVNSISRMSEEEFAKMSDEVIKLSTKMPQSAKVLADGLYDIASSGFQGAEGMEVLAASAKAASAGMTDTATASKGVVAVLNAYGWEADQASRVSDTMFKTVDKGVISFEELSSQIGEVVGTANIAHIGFEELSGMIAYMTTKGIGAAEATTALNRMMLAIITPTEELAVVLKDAGYESGQMAIEQLGLTGVMDLMSVAADGDVATINALSGDMRAFKAVASLTGSGMEALNEFMVDYSGVAATAGSTTVALEEQSKALQFQLNLLKNNVSAIAITLGTEFIPKLTKLTESISKFVSENKDAVVGIGKLGGAAVVAVGGLLLVAGAIGKVRAAVILLNSSIIGSAGFMTLLRTLGSGFAAFGAVGGPAIGAFVEDIGAFKTAAGDFKHIVNDMQGIKMTNWFKFGVDADEIVDLTNKIQDYAKAVSESGTEYEKQKVMELNDARRKGSIDLKEFYDLLPPLGEAQRKQSYFTDMVTKSMEAQGKSAVEISRVLRGTTEVIEEETKSIQDLRDEFNQLTNDIFGGITTYNDFQEAGWAVEEAEKALAAAIKEHGEESREAEQSQNNLDAAMITSIQTAFELSNEIGATTEQQEEARKKAVELGLEYVNTEQIGAKAFLDMAKAFGMSAADIIDFADKMGIEIDYVTRARLVVVEFNEQHVNDATKRIQQAIDELHGKTVTLETIYKTSRILGAGLAMGGIVGYANGGVVGNDGYSQPMLTAASGIITPQTGRAIPIMAHENEIIANTSQQKNLAEWIMGKANTKPDGNGGGQEVTLHIPLSVDGRVLYDVWEKYDLMEQARRI